MNILPDISCPITQISNSSLSASSTILTLDTVNNQKLSYVSQNNYPIADFKVSEHSFCEFLNEINISPGKVGNYKLEISKYAPCAGTDPRYVDFDKMNEEEFFTNNTRTFGITQASTTSSPNFLDTLVPPLTTSSNSDSFATQNGPTPVASLRLTVSSLSPTTFCLPRSTTSSLSWSAWLYLVLQCLLYCSGSALWSGMSHTSRKKWCTMLFSSLMTKLLNSSPISMSGDPNPEKSSSSSFNNSSESLSWLLSSLPFSNCCPPASGSSKCSNTHAPKHSSTTFSVFMNKKSMQSQNSSSSPSLFGL